MRSDCRIAWPIVSGGGLGIRRTVPQMAAVSERASLRAARPVLDDQRLAGALRQALGSRAVR